MNIFFSDGAAVFPKVQEPFPLPARTRGGFLPFYDIGSPEKRRGEEGLAERGVSTAQGGRGFLFSFYKGRRLAFFADTFISIPYFLFLQGHARTGILFSTTCLT
ncbi:hypothetical protein CXU17_02095 [Akkermansia muciniphila]|nr:hypothetical protein CXU17_02095 [Akkermansia muciniphila]